MLDGMEARRHILGPSFVAALTSQPLNDLPIRFHPCNPWFPEVESLRW
jgi:hypothetical protein